MKEECFRVMAFGLLLGCCLTSSVDEAEAHELLPGHYLANSREEAEAYERFLKEFVSFSDCSGDHSLAKYLSKYYEIKNLVKNAPRASDFDGDVRRARCELLRRVANCQMPTNNDLHAAYFYDKEKVFSRNFDLLMDPEHVECLEMYAKFAGEVKRYPRCDYKYVHHLMCTAYTNAEGKIVLEFGDLRPLKERVLSKRKSDLSWALSRVLQYTDSQMRWSVSCLHDEGHLTEEKIRRLSALSGIDASELKKGNK
jgi:hypothetical protein